jgi:TetR/AcrR family transcriptional repressor of nem operon
VVIGEATTKTRLLEAGQRLMLRRGFTATRVDEVCAEAGVTKGSFFHYFESKDEFAEAVLGHNWSSTQPMLRSAFAKSDDPLQRVHDYLDLFVAVAADPHVEKSCLFGNLSQEVAPTHPRLRSACRLGFSRWAEQVALRLEDAKQAHPPAIDFDSASLAAHLIAIYEGSLVLAKAAGDAQVLAANVEHFRRYLQTLFGTSRCNAEDHRKGGGRSERSHR